MPADGWKVVLSEVENTLSFSNAVTFLCSIDVDNWVLESQYIIPTSAIKGRKYTHLLQYSQVTW